MFSIIIFIIYYYFIILLFVIKYTAINKYFPDIFTKKGM